VAVLTLVGWVMVDLMKDTPTATAANCVPPPASKDNRRAARVAHLLRNDLP
jgi:hypothetical protein